jgi:hypothetical protein
MKDNLIERTYQPKGYDSSCISTVKITKEQAEILDMMEKINPYRAYFWSTKIEAIATDDILLEDNKLAVRIDGACYIIGAENDGGLRGFSGRKFTIEFISGKFKGQIIDTTNLWHQGEIPEELKSMLPDSARFIKNEKDSDNKIWQDMGLK